MAAETVTVETVIQKLGLIAHLNGGFFLETFRSGSTPMSTRGETDFNVPDEDLVLTTNRTDRRPDHDGRRNALNSVYWMPTGASPKMHLITNLSDQVIYYHSGDPFEMTLFNPQTKKLKRVVIGGNLLAGHKFQLPVKGGIWKCGRLLVEDSQDTSRKESYCLVGEATAPGFDIHDFSQVTVDMFKKTVPRCCWKTLKPFLHDKIDDDDENDDLTLTEEWTSYDD